MVSARYQTLLAACFLTVQAPQGMARAAYGMAGCGLGSLVLYPNTGGCSEQTSAATTNGTSSNQGFGITFGTSNCVGGGSKSIVQEIQQQFFDDNFATLAKEMAQGQGETLTSFATMFGCDQQSAGIFAKGMQTSYSEIFAAPGTGAAMHVIRRHVKADARLVARCTEVI